MAALYRTVALEQVHDIAVVVGENLQFDVAGIGVVLFHEDIGAAEGLGRLGDNAVIIAPEVRLVFAAADAAAAAARGRFEHDGVTDLARIIGRLVDNGDAAVAARGGRGAGRRRRRARRGRGARAAGGGGGGAEGAGAAAGAY